MDCGQVDRAASSQEPVPDDIEQKWRTFWRPTIAPNGVIDLNQVKRELYDYSFLLEQVPKVYMHITGGRMSKPNYFASEVISVSDDYVTELVEKESSERLADEQTAEVAAPSEDHAVPQGVPVAWMLPRKGEDRAEFHEADEPFNDSFKTLGWTPLYAAPSQEPAHQYAHIGIDPGYEPSQEPVTLTDEQALKDAFEEGYCARSTYNDVDISDVETEWAKSSAKASIAALREKQGVCK